METTSIISPAHIYIAITIFSVLYILISLEKINKTILALIGASLFLLSGLISQDAAFLEHVDWNVILLLISMMVIVGITKESGLFQYVALKTAKITRGNPVYILILFALITAFFSALLDNVTTVLILTPITILIAVELGISPLPFVISDAIASNIGGTATLIGDPPNIMIGSKAGLSFMQFITNLGPVILVIITAYIAFAWLVFGRKMHVSNERRARIMEIDETKAITNKTLLIKSLIVISLVIIGFFIHGALGLEPATIAMAGAAILMLLTGEEEVDKFFHEVEWGTIFFFLGLFIMVGALVEVGAIKMLSQWVLKLTGGDIKLTSIVVLWFSGIFSAIVDNIPYVATMIPMIDGIGQTIGATAILPLWWSLALGACLGGNGTLVGASANVVSAGIATKSGYKISFIEFTKYGAGFTIISLAISMLYIMIRYVGF
ncbi:ArsB/NhaD family transporter [Spirochaetia bacterium 38H-sp]|uniref:ArsB/NhaD family transporter n=1 Tax=Rarispira pelagica TaxID=3141764 RepID=A0ABU9UBB8_9SPIR